MYNDSLLFLYSQLKFQQISALSLQDSDVLKKLLPKNEKKRFLQGNVSTFDSLLIYL